MTRDQKLWLATGLVLTGSAISLFWANALGTLKIGESPVATGASFAVFFGGLAALIGAGAGARWTRWTALRVIGVVILIGIWGAASMALGQSLDRMRIVPYGLEDLVTLSFMALPVLLIVINSRLRRSPPPPSHQEPKNP